MCSPTNGDWLKLLSILREEKCSCLPSNTRFSQSWLEASNRIVKTFWFVFWGVCKVVVSNKSLSSTPPNQAPVPGCRNLCSVLIICADVLWRVCSSDTPNWHRSQIWFLKSLPTTSVGGLLASLCVDFYINYCDVTISQTCTRLCITTVSSKIVMWNWLTNYRSDCK